jgi:hypothetical protein
VTLLDLAEQHRGAFEYDWRARFHTRFDLPGDMSWGEVWRLTQILVTDPSSHLAASVAGWDFPVERGWLVAADMYDAFVSANTPKGRKTKPYPRPWQSKDRNRFGRATRPQHEIFAALRARGHGRILHKRDRDGRLRDERGRFVKA